MLITKKLKIDNNKIFGISNSDGKLFYCWIQLDYLKCQSLKY